ncbi:DUF6771 family protein [Sphingomonas sp. PB4P5]|uniref:DUF6771 family protein n=1 Tax=Parasphingomonas puruogangriensis TaxID=3096155 RepID=UPI002FCAC345
MNNDFQATITATIARAPDWIRQELLSKEKTTRARAEEALAAMIADAIQQNDSDPSGR